MTCVCVLLLPATPVFGQGPAGDSEFRAAAVAYERTTSAAATATPGAAGDTSGEDEPDAGDPIPGSYIVRFAEDSGPRGESEITKAARNLTSRVGGRVTGVYTTALKGFSAKLSAGQAREMARRPGVASVRQDTLVKAVSARSAAPSPQVGPPWHLDRLDQADLPLSGTFDGAGADGSGTHIYILDSGVRATHEEFGGRVKDGPPGTDHDDCSDHGTAVAGVAAGKTFGVAKNATIHRVRVLGCEGAGPAVNVLKAIDWVTKNASRPAVVNTSWTTGHQKDLYDALINSIHSGLTYVAGASSSDVCRDLPGGVPEVITVGSVDHADQRRIPSSGTCIDLFAPGEKIVTASRDSDTATQVTQGSSVAAPIVAGAAAVYLSAHPRATPKEVADALIACASTGVVVDPGPGSPNRLISTDCGDKGRIRLANPGRQVTVKGHPVKISTAGVTGTAAGSVRYSATGLPAGVSIDAATGVISGTPTETGATVVKITATDGEASASASFAWDLIHAYGRISLAGRDDLCIDNANGRMSEGNKIWLHESCRQNWFMGDDGRIVFQKWDNNYCVTVSDKDSADGPLIVLSACSDSAAQVWKSYADGTLRNPATGKCLNAPNLDENPQLTLADCGGGEKQEWRMPRLPKNQLTIRLPRTKVTPRGDAVSMRIPVITLGTLDTAHGMRFRDTSEPADVLIDPALGMITNLDTTQRPRYSATGLPDGLSIDPATGVITGSPRVSGSTTVTVTVTLNGGFTASASLSWQVTDGSAIAS